MLIINQLTESLKFAWQALQGNKLRTFLSLLGITIGIFAIILVYSVVDSLEKSIRDSVASLGDNVVYVQKWPFGGSPDYPWWKYMNRPEPTLKDAAEISARSATAAQVVFMFSTRTTAKYRSNSVENATLQGAQYGYEAIWDFNLTEGRYFTENESNTGKPYCIIGATVAEGLFGPVSPIGKRIKVSGKKVTVIGVFERTGASMIGQQYDEMILVSAAFLSQIVDPDFSGGNSIIIKAKEGVSVSQLKDETMGHLRAIHRLKPQVEPDFSLNEVSMLSSGLDSLFGVIGIAGTFIGGFSILVGGFGIANIMFVSVKERTTEIGVQKALGARNSFILFQFLIESIMLCLIGGIIGLILVYFAAFGAAKAFDFNIYLSTGNIVLGVVLSLIIGLVSGFLPAYTASRMVPVDAIRYKQ